MVCKQCEPNNTPDEEILLEKTNHKLFTVNVCNKCGNIYVKLPEPIVEEVPETTLDDLSIMSMTELKDFAESKGISVDGSIKKKVDLRAYIESKL